MQYHVIVADKRTGTELARYTYPNRAQAQEAAKSVNEVRKQNGERVVVVVSVGK